MKMTLIGRFPAAICALWLGTISASALETFQLAHSPGGIPFWHLLREEEPRAIVIASFPDDFALRRPDMIAAPLVGASVIQLGPAGVSAGEYNEQLKDVQGNCSLSAEPMSATFLVEARVEDFGEALELCMRPLMQPALRLRDFERIRRSAVTGRARLESNRPALATHVMRRLSWHHSAFARWGEPGEIAKIEAASVDLWRSEVFARSKFTLVAVGPLKVEVVGALIDRSFGRLPERTVAVPLEAPSPVYPPKTIVFERAGDQTALLMEGALPIESTESPAATIGNNVLGGGLDRRLGRAIRGEQGATYGISSGMGALAPGKRNFSIRSSLANDLAAAAVQKVRDVTENWRSEGVSDLEVSRSRGLLVSSYERSIERIDSKAGAMMTMLKNGRTAEDEAGYMEKIRSTTTAEVNRVLRERMPRAMTTVIVAPSADGFNADCVIRKVEEIDTCR